MGRARIAKTIKTRSPRLADKVTDAVQAALEAQTVTLPAEAAFGQVITELCGDLDRLQGRRDALAEQIEEVFLAHPFGQLLVSLSGIGHAPAAGSSPKPVTAPASPTDPSSPATPAAPP